MIACPEPAAEATRCASAKPRAWFATRATPRPSRLLWRGSSYPNKHLFCRTNSIRTAAHRVFSPVQCTSEGGGNNLPFYLRKPGAPRGKCSYERTSGSPKRTGLTETNAPVPCVRPSLAALIYTTNGVKCVVPCCLASFFSPSSSERTVVP